MVCHSSKCLAIRVVEYEKKSSVLQVKSHYYVFLQFFKYSFLVSNNSKNFNKTFVLS